MSHHHQSAFEYLPAICILAIGLIYLLLRLYGGGRRLGILPSLSFLIGLSLLAIGLSPSMMAWGHADIRGHMVQHLLIAMYAPIFLVLGMPLTLVLQALPAKYGRRLTAILHSKLLCFLAHPLVALIINIGAMYVLYLTPLYTNSLHNNTMHVIIHLHFIMAGYLFTWSIIGPDPARRRSGMITRLLAMFLSIGLHANLSKMMFAYALPAVDIYSVEQKREAAKLMYYWGDLSEIIILIFLLYLWLWNKSRNRQHITLLPN